MIKKILYSIIIFSIFVTTASASEKNVEEVLKTLDDFTNIIDADEIVNPPKEKKIKRIWAEQYYAYNTMNSPTTIYQQRYTLRRSLYDLNCEKKTYKLLYRVAITDLKDGGDRNEYIEINDLYKKEWSYILPITRELILYRLVCIGVK